MAIVNVGVFILLVALGYYIGWKQGCEDVLTTLGNAINEFRKEKTDEMPVDERNEEV